MKFWKILALGLILFLTLVQIPAIYHRYCTYNQHAFINKLELTRLQNEDPGYLDYAGVIHVHSKIGGDSKGTFEEIESAAQVNELDFVVMTEHTSVSNDTYGRTLEGEYGGIVYLSGYEASVSDGNRFLVVEGFPTITKATRLTTPEFLKQSHSSNRLALITHPENSSRLDKDADGIEVFSLHTNANEMSPVSFLLDALWSYSSYPGLTLARHFKRPDAALEQFDEMAAQRKLTLFAGTDAHSNLALQVGSESPDRFIDIKLDSYQKLFGIVKTRVLLSKNKECSKEEIVKALRNGQSYVGFDVLGNTSGFRFEAVLNEKRTIMGGETELVDGLKLISHSPQPARFVVFRNGKKFFESEGANNISLKLSESGIYRVEVYRDELGSPFDRTPWIISNPVYIR